MRPGRKSVLQVPFGDVKPRVTVAVNTPATAPKSVRGAHTDNARKAYVGLLYFRLPEDESTGGDLEIFRWKDGVTPKPWAVAADPSEVERVKTIEVTWRKTKGDGPSD